MNNTDVSKTAESTEYIILLLERANAALRYLLDDVYSWSKDHHEAEEWNEVISGYDQTATFLNITEDYLTKALEEARALDERL